MVRQPTVQGGLGMSNQEQAFARIQRHAYRYEPTMESAMRSRIMTVGASALVLTGCGGASTVVNEPSKISLKLALEETVDALFAARYRSAQQGGTAIGLNACTVTAT